MKTNGLTTQTRTPLTYTPLRSRSGSDDSSSVIGNIGSQILDTLRGKQGQPRDTSLFEEEEVDLRGITSGSNLELDHNEISLLAPLHDPEESEVNSGQFSYNENNYEETLTPSSHHEDDTTYVPTEESQDAPVTSGHLSDDPQDSALPDPLDDDPQDVSLLVPPETAPQEPSVDPNQDNQDDGILGDSPMTHPTSEHTPVEWLPSCFLGTNIMDDIPPFKNDYVMDAIVLFTATYARNKLPDFQFNNYTTELKGLLRYAGVE